MRYKLVFLDSYESDFKDNHYYIYQFVCPNTLTLFNYSSKVELSLLQVGNEYVCKLGSKRGKLCIIDIENVIS